MKKSFNLLVIALVMTSCAPVTVMNHLTPEAPRGHYEMGREYITLNNDSIFVELGYDGLHGDNLVFDFVVINRTPGELSVNPSDFYYVLLDSATADSSILPPRMALHPQRVLHSYEETLEASSSLKSINSVIGFLDTGMDLLVNTTAFLASEDPGYILDALFGTVNNAGYYISKDNQISHNMNLIGEEKKIVSEEIFKECLVPPGKVVSGYVFFPGNPAADYYMFSFPLEDQLFQFVYNQHLIYQYLY